MTSLDSDSYHPKITRLERLRNTPVWIPLLPARSAKPASAPAAVAGKARLTSGGATITNNTLSAEGRPSTYGPATKAFTYKHHRADKTASLHQPGRLEALGVGGASTITFGGASALSFKAWSENPGMRTSVRKGTWDGRCVCVGGDAAATTTANRGNNVQNDQSSIGTLLGDRCYTPSGVATRGPDSSSPTSALVEGKRVAGAAIAVAAPASDFGVTTAMSHLGMGSGGGSMASAAAPAPLALARSDRRLLYALVQLSTR